MLEIGAWGDQGVLGRAHLFHSNELPVPAPAGCIHRRHRVSRHVRAPMFHVAGHKEASAFQQNVVPEYGARFIRRGAHLRFPSCCTLVFDR